MPSHDPDNTIENKILPSFGSKLAFHVLKSAKNWQLAKYEPEIRDLLGLPPESEKENENPEET